MVYAQHIQMKIHDSKIFLTCFDRFDKKIWHHFCFASLLRCVLLLTFLVICREWLYEICRGIDHELVKERHLAQSVGCSKTFRGAEALNTRTKVKHWIGCLATELTERLIRDREIVSIMLKLLKRYFRCLNST